jgi:hypothetical protein
MPRSAKKRAIREIQDELLRPGPYSHNIIGIILRKLARERGDEAAFAVIRETGLEKFGWKGKP